MLLLIELLIADAISPLQVLHLWQIYNIPFNLNHARPTCIIITCGSHLSDRSRSVALNYISYLKGRVLYL